MTLSREDFEVLAREVGVEDFDLMLVGDGSGGKWHDSCGWFCGSYHRASGKTAEHFGGASCGTSNLAELAPYAHTLWAFEAARGERKSAPPRVLIVSDSELTVRCGEGMYARKANLSLWASIDWFVAQGYKLVWRHVRRNSNPISKRADKVAGEVRGEMEKRKR